MGTHPPEHGYHTKEPTGEISVSKNKEHSGAITGVIISVTTVYLLFSLLRSVNIFDVSQIKIFNTVFISILMQAFPFMMVGVLVSSAMHIFIPDDWIVKIFPVKYGLGFLTAMFAGVFFPVCECAIVPVMTRLIKKGVSMPIAVTFMLSAPIINPIVIISTLYAFPGQPQIMIMRVCFGLLIAFLTGISISVCRKSLPIFKDSSGDSEHNCHNSSEENSHESHDCNCNCCTDHEHNEKRFFQKLSALFLHAGDEFFKVGKYLVIGACITSLIQTFIPKEIFTKLGMQSWLSLLVMMVMAFLFSACSTSDAFIARSFLNRFPLGSVMGFLVFGPMMDIKTLLMLLSGFKKAFVIKLSLIIFILNFIFLNILTIIFL